MKGRSDRRHLRLAMALVVIVVTAGLVWGLATAVAASPSPSASPAKLTLRLGTTIDCDDLNPFVGYSRTAYEVYHLNYDLLVGYDAQTLKPRPELATSWSVSADGLTWTFGLREGVTWQDGERFTARDVAFTYNYIIANKLAAFTAYTKDIKKVVVVDDTTVQFRCRRPKANMLRLWVPILPEHIWSKVPGGRAAEYHNSVPLVGTGPFQVVSVKKGEYVRLERNPDYWRTGKPAIDEVVFVIYRNAEAMTKDLETGRLDYAMGIPSARFRSLASEAGLATNAAPTRYFDELCMNCYEGRASLGNPVLRDPAFRQAISWAVDKREIVESAYGGYARVGQGIITPDVPTYYWEPPATARSGFDLEKAKAMLDAAGYRDTDGDGVREYRGKPIALRLWGRSGDLESRRCARLVTGWFRQIGIKITPATLDTAAITDALYHREGGAYAPDFDIFIWGWAEYVDPDYILGAFTSDQIGWWNDACWSNEEYDRLYERQAQELDRAKRKRIVDRMLRIFYSEAPYIVTDYEQQLEAYDIAHWQGWTEVGRHGPVAFSNDNIDSYLNLRPRTVDADAGGSDTWWTYALVTAAAILVVVVAVLLIRRYGHVHVRVRGE